jgi:uncharacterized membrane protein
VSFFGADPSQWNEWRFLWASPWSSLTLILVALGLLVSLVFYFGSLQSAPRKRKIILLSLRISALAFLFLLFSMPSLELSSVTRSRSEVLVLLDSSASMALPGSIGGPTRNDLLQSFLKENASFFEGISKDHNISVFSFDETVNPGVLTQAPTPQGSASYTREAITSLLEKYQDKELGGILVFSDGADNGALANIGAEGIARDDLWKTLQKKQIPVHTFFTGVDGSVRDLSISEINVGEFAFVHNATEVEVTVSSAGIPEAQDVAVTLSRGGKPITAKEVRLPKEGGSAKVTFRLVPEEIGKAIYQIDVPVFENEAVTENNQREFVLQVIRDKIRVLQVVGRPSWDERYLRDLLKQDPNVDLISFFILRGSLDLQPVPSDEISLIPFPTDELFGNELPSFDVVIFQNFNHAPYGVSPFLPQVKSYVEGGGGFVMLGGDLSFTQGDYDETPVEDILPVSLSEPKFDNEGEDSLWVSGEFQAQLTEKGLRHPVSAFAEGASANREKWANLPPLEGLNRVEKVRPEATVLATHPTAKLNGEPAPLLVVQEFGKGRSLSFLSDSLWMWSFGAKEKGDTNDAFREFWKRAVRWLIKDPELKPLRIVTDQERYNLGDNVKVYVRAYTADYQPAKNLNISLAVGAARGDTPPTKTELMTNEEGEAFYEYKPSAAGVQLATAKATLQGKEIVEEAAFVVTQKGDELRQVAPRADLLKALAASTNGQFFTLPQSLSYNDGAELSLKPPRVVKVNQRKEEPIWSSIPFLLLPILLLCFEWWLRRKWGHR